MKTTLLILSLITFTHSLYAQDTHTKKKEVRTEEEASPAATTAMSTAHIDLLGGAVIPVGDIGDAIKTRFGFGGQFLFAVAPEFHIGAFYQTSSGAVKDIEELDYRLSYYGLVGQIYFNPSVFLQMKAGLSSHEVSGTVEGTNFSLSSKGHPFFVGAGLGVNMPISGNVSFAPYAGWIHSFKKESADESFDAYDLVEVMAALRFNF